MTGNDSAERSAGALDASAAEQAHDEFAVLVGWAHSQFTRGIQLKLQSQSSTSDGQGKLTERRYLMTRNQALLLANYLLEASNQSLPPRQRDGWLRRLGRRLSGG